jgi:NADPH-dependent curcumin reductase CurA
VKEGNFYGGYLPYQTLQKLSAKTLAGMWNLTDFVTKETISLGCGILGMPGATAYGGLLKVRSFLLFNFYLFFFFSFFSPGAASKEG